MAFQEFSKALCFSYGEGVYARDGRQYKGQVVLTPHKLYLKDETGEIAPTFVPLEKIYKIKVFWGRMTIYARPSNFMHFNAQLKGSSKMIRSLMKDLVEHRQLQKKRFGLEWIDPEENVM